MVPPSRRAPVHPIGYQEFQAAWVGEKTAEEYAAEMGALRAKARQEAPHLVETNIRVEHVPDGAGIIHTHLYIGFAPARPAAEPLGPVLNDADEMQPGQGPDPTDNIGVPIGYFEQQFNRGKP